ncbi:AAA family ATPase [Chitinophaga ginsengisoli]|uniref:AAA domain-containing protein n=1 Tax=Chitinophaga ginsengisoli TaxID=363837 RepID=A0A2P8GI42_9BACT|nr:AAA family ATPase [Chitinophaga ginsengisoli]PSL33631.1 AAA domain-containing protein [Chitinophaga ginsengisoli]
MRITKLELRNFKRFSDLTIDKIPETSKLVLLVGANGSGKSSIFDGFDFMSRQVTRLANKAHYTSSLKPYYFKDGDNLKIVVTFSNGEQNGIEWDQFIGESNVLKRKFVGRSSIRIVPRITNRGSAEEVSNNKDAPASFIDVDERFYNDVALYIQQIDNALREPVFSGRSADTLQIFQDFIYPLNSSLLNIFGGDEATTIQIAEFQNATPQESAKLIFKKGTSKINYDLLSHGEKQVVILLLNFIVRKEQYKDAIIYIDEMDCHLNTSLQSKLLSEVVNVWIPDDAQLWTASHALGFIDFARHADNASIIDLDSLNFDVSQLLIPEPKENLEVYTIALPKETLENILRDYKLVVVENQNAAHYNLALSGKNYLFLPEKDSRDVFLNIKGDTTKLGIRDRDYIMDDEITRLQKKYPNLRILRYYAFENYIYHPDNIAELDCEGFDKAAYINEITTQKNDKLLTIAAGIEVARQSYSEFKDGVQKNKDIEPILQALKSDDFEVFYPFFSMKTYYSRVYLQLILNKYTVSDLVKTNWFKTKIEQLLKADS